MDLQKILKEKEEIAYLQGIEFSVITFSDAEEIAIKYARQVAEKTLKDAADKYKGITMKDDFGCICDVQNAILSTPIITP